AGGDRLSAAVRLVLARVREARRDRGDPLRRGPLERIDHDEVLHHPRVDRGEMRLQDEDVRAAHGLAVAHVDLSVGEVPGVHLQDLDAELVRHLLREDRVGPPGGVDQSLLPGCYDSAHRCSLSLCSSAAVSAGVLAADPSSVPRAARAAASAAVPARRRSVHPSMFRCETALTPSAPAGTSLRTVVPAPVAAPSPLVTGATSPLSEPTRTCRPTVVRCLSTPS